MLCTSVAPLIKINLSISKTLSFIAKNHFFPQSITTVQANNINTISYIDGLLGTGMTGKPGIRSGGRLIQ